MLCAEALYLGKYYISPCCLYSFHLTNPFHQYSCYFVITWKFVSLYNISNCFCSISSMLFLELVLLLHSIIFKKNFHSRWLSVSPIFTLPIIGFLKMLQQFYKHILLVFFFLRFTQNAIFQKYYLRQAKSLLKLLRIVNRILSVTIRYNFTCFKQNRVIKFGTYFYENSSITFLALRTIWTPGTVTFRVPISHLNEISKN